MTDDEFIATFEAQGFPLDKWHHRDHLRIAYLYLRRYPFDEAVARIRSGIQALNAAHKVPDALDRGYHETMTQAWMRLVQFSLKAFGPRETADAFLDEHSELFSTRLLRLFYSRERIMSAAAKNGFVEPDLTPFPASTKGSRTNAEVERFAESRREEH